MKFSVPALAIACGALLGAQTPALAATPGFGSSGALALVVLSVAGTPVIVPPLEPSDGTGRPSYHQKSVLLGGGLNVTLPVLAGLAPLSVIVTVPSGKTAAEGYPMPGGGASSLGKSEIGNLRVSIQSTLLGITTNVLTIGAVNLKTSAFSTTTPAGVETIGTKAGAKGLVISGLLVGGTPIKITGPLKRNSVLFSSPLLTITAHETYSSKNGAGEKTVTINGLDIWLLSAPVLGSVLDGHIFVNTDTAF